MTVIKTLENQGGKDKQLNDIINLSSYFALFMNLTFH